MEIISKCAVTVVLGSLVSLLIKKNIPEFSAVLGIAVTVIVLSLALSLLSTVTDIIVCATGMLGTSSALLRPLLKCLGISLITKFSSDICRDSSQSAAAASLEFSGTLCALSVAAPVIITMIKMIGTMI